MPRRAAGTGRICKECGVNDSTGVHVSTRLLCLDCSETRQIAALVQISDGNGPVHEKRIAALRRYVERSAGDTLAG